MTPTGPAPRTAVADVDREVADADVTPAEPASGASDRPARRTGATFLRRLPPRTRAVAIATLVAAVLWPLCAAVVALQDGWQVLGDNAIISLRSNDVFSTDPPLLGQPTTAEGYGDAPKSFTLGPVQYYLLAPFVLVLGRTAGPAIGSALLVGSLAALSIWLALRRGGIVLMAMVTLGVAWVGWSTGAGQLFDPLNSEVTMYALSAALLLAWSLAIGDVHLLPLAAVVTSFCAQVHAASAGFVVIPMALGVGLLVRRVVRARRSGRPPPAALGRRLQQTAVVVLVLWLPPIIDQLTSPRSNVVDFLRGAFAADHLAGVRFAVDQLGSAVGPPPLFLRQVPPGLQSGNGEPWAVVVGVVLVGLVGSAGLVLRRRGQRSAAVWCAIVVTGAISGIVNLAELPEVLIVRPDVQRWRWVLPMLVWVTLLWAAWLLLADTIRQRWSGALTSGLLVVALLVAGLTVWGSGAADTSDGQHMAGYAAWASEVEARLPKGHYRVTYDGDVIGLSIGPGLVNHLEGDGYSLTVDASFLDRAYGPERTGPGTSIGADPRAGPGQQRAPGGRPVAGCAPHRRRRPHQGVPGAAAMRLRFLVAMPVVAALLRRGMGGGGPPGQRAEHAAREEAAEDVLDLRDAGPAGAEPFPRGPDRLGGRRRPGRPDVRAEPEGEGATTARCRPRRGARLHPRAPSPPAERAARRHAARPVLP